MATSTPPSPAAPPLPSWLQAAGAGALVGGYLGFTSTIAGVHAVLLMAAILALGLHRKAWRVVFALGVLPLAPLVALIAHRTLDVVIVRALCEWSFDLTHYEMLAITAFFTVPGVISFLIALFAAKRARHLPPLLLQIASLSSLALAALLLAVTAPRALRAPDHEHYVESLPVLGVLAPADGEPTKIRVGEEIPRGGSSSRPPREKTDPPERYTTRIYDASMGDLRIRRLCPSFRSDCFLELRLAEQPFSPAIEARFDREPQRGSASWGCNPEELWVESGGAITVREDAFHSLILFDGNALHAVRRPALAPTGVHVRDVIRTTSPPRGFVASAALGALVAVGFGLRGVRARRRLARLARARQGELGHDGWITIDDGSPPLRAGERGLPVGPVLLVGAAFARAPAGPYRGDELQAGVEVLAGERSALMAGEREVLRQCAVCALGVVMLTAAPLFVAARVWALF